MKTIITTVGTSLFTNLTKNGHNDRIAQKYEDLKDIRFSEWNSNKSTIDILRSLIKNAIKKNDNASAEIESIQKIAKGENVIIHLLATDTVLSVLAAEIIKDWFGDSQTVYFNAQYGQDVVQDLQVENLGSFKTGLKNLITRFYRIVDIYNPNNYVLNITGGYKALIPFITILGQITKIDIKYKFEDTDGLIEIPRLPIKRDDELFDKYADIFTLIENENDFVNTSEYYQFSKDAESCLEFYDDGKVFDLNALGRLFWEDYKKQFFNFYCPDDVWGEIEKQKDILRILRTKFWNPQIWKSSKNEQKGDKWCYDDGDNNNRIYYLFRNNKLFIYKTFESESEAKKFITKKIDFDAIISNSKLRKIKIENV